MSGTLKISYLRGISLAVPDRRRFLPAIAIAS